MNSLSSPSAEWLERLARIAGPGGAISPEDAASYLEEPRGRWRGRAATVLRPATVAAVSEIVRECAAERVALVPYAGGTGLVGGQILTDGPPPVLLSVERLRAVRRIDLEDAAVIAEAGVVLADLHAALEPEGRIFPLRLASEGSARLGGLLATNAGGVAVLRYGNMRDLCLGLEAVLPDGSVLRGLKTLRKDNMGYDLRHLLIGSEGTLGIITAAALKLYPKPRHREVALAVVPNPAGAVRLLRLCQSHLGDAISAFELMSAQGMAFVLEKIDGARAPFAAPPAWMVLIDAGAGRPVRDSLETALTEGVEAGLVADAVMAETIAQRQAFWRLREDMPIANRKIGAVANHDISAPVARIAEFIDAAGAALARAAPALRINCFGHIGDGNLHYNLFPPAGEDAATWRPRRGELTRIVHDLVDAVGGSVSAEHGVGRLKVAELARYGDPAKLAAMRAVKQALDPLGIMNPGAVVPGMDVAADA